MLYSALDRACCLIVDICQIKSNNVSTCGFPTMQLTFTLTLTIFQLTGYSKTHIWSPGGAGLPSPRGHSPLWGASSQTESPSIFPPVWEVIALAAASPLLLIEREWAAAAAPKLGVLRSLRVFNGPLSCGGCNDQSRLPHHSAWRLAHHCSDR